MGTPFVNVTIDGLLWGYEDELPCLPLDVPKGCNKGNDPFSGDDDPFEGEDDGWDFGSGAGFYVDATTEPWSKHYRMYSYVTKELPELINVRTEPVFVFL